MLAIGIEHLNLPPRKWKKRSRPTGVLFFMHRKRRHKLRLLQGYRVCMGPLYQDELLYSNDVGVANICSFHNTVHGMVDTIAVADISHHGASTNDQSTLLGHETCIPSLVALHRWESTWLQNLLNSPLYFDTMYHSRMGSLHVLTCVIHSSVSVSTSMLLWKPSRSLAMHGNHSELSGPESAQRWKQQWWLIHKMWSLWTRCMTCDITMHIRGKLQPDTF